MVWLLNSPPLVFVRGYPWSEPVDEVLDSTVEVFGTHGTG